MAYSYYNKAETTGYSSTQSNANVHTYYNYTQTDGTNQTASYSYVIEYNGANHSFSTNEERYMCLSGYKDDSDSNNLRRVKNGTTNQTYSLKTNSYVSHTGHYFSYTSGNTTNYLTRGATGLNATTPTSSSLWIYESNTIYTANNTEDKYYLNCDSSGNLSVTTTSSTTWNYDSTRSAYYANVSSTNHYLGFNGSSWTTTTFVQYTLISSGTHYMSHPNTTGFVDVVESSDVNASNPSESIRWYKSGTNFKTTASGNYYLGIHKSQDFCYYDTTSNIDLLYQSGNRLMYSGNNKWYAYYSSSTTYPWPVVKKTEYTLTFTDYEEYTTDIHCSNISYSDASTNFYHKTSTTTSKNAGLITNATYFPLKSELAANGNLTVEDANTGYVVSGSYFTTDPYGDIRVSSFGVSDLSGSYNSSTEKFTTIYTYQGGSTQTVDLTTGQIGNTTKKFERFANASSQLLGTLTDDDANGNIYGLHFMDASISMSHLIKAPYVKVADKDPKDLVGNEDPFSIYTNYEMPEDSIDFHFKENGIINFFAGTYYTNSDVGDNDTFFSLHQIERYKTGETLPTGKAVGDIKSIKQISKIYENTDANTKGETPYVYQYSDNSTSSIGTIGTGATALFDTAWITNPTIDHLNSAYYFEVPANKGEYALGSVAGKQGSYLMYLDLGANANRVGRTRISEHFVETEDVYDYPLGVSFVSSFTTTNVTIGDKVVAVLDVDPINSANFVVEPGYTGSVTANRSSASAMTATISNSTDKAKIKAGYYKETIAFTDGTSPLTNKPRETITRDIQRIEIFDYGINNLYLTRTVAEEIITTHAYLGVVNSSETTDTKTLKQYVYNSNGTLNTAKTITDPSLESTIKVYNPDDTTTPGQPYSDPKNQLLGYLNIYADDNHIVYKFSYTTPTGVAETITYDLTYLLSVTNDQYIYSATGYNIVITVTGDLIVVKVESNSGTYTITINSSAVATGSTVTINP